MEGSQGEESVDYSELLPVEILQSIFEHSLFTPALRRTSKSFKIVYDALFKVRYMMPWINKKALIPLRLSVPFAPVFDIKVPLTTEKLVGYADASYASFANDAIRFVLSVMDSSERTVDLLLDDSEGWLCLFHSALLDNEHEECETLIPQIYDFARLRIKPEERSVGETIFAWPYPSFNPWHSFFEMNFREEKKEIERIGGDPQAVSYFWSALDSDEEEEESVHTSEEDVEEEEEEESEHDESAEDEAGEGHLWWGEEEEGVVWEVDGFAEHFLQVLQEPQEQQPQVPPEDGIVAPTAPVDEAPPRGDPDPFRAFIDRIVYRMIVSPKSMAEYPGLWRFFRCLEDDWHILAGLTAPRRVSLRKSLASPKWMVVYYDSLEASSCDGRKRGLHKIGLVQSARSVLEFGRSFGSFGDHIIFAPRDCFLQSTDGVVLVQGLEQRIAGGLHRVDAGMNALTRCWYYAFLSLAMRVVDLEVARMHGAICCHRCICSLETLHKFIVETTLVVGRTLSAGVSNRISARNSTSAFFSTCVLLWHSKREDRKDYDPSVFVQDYLYPMLHRPEFSGEGTGEHDAYRWLRDDSMIAFFYAVNDARIPLHVVEVPMKITRRLSFDHGFARSYAVRKNDLPRVKWHFLRHAIETESEEHATSALAFYPGMDLVQDLYGAIRDEEAPDSREDKHETFFCSLARALERNPKILGGTLDKVSEMKIPHLGGVCAVVYNVLARMSKRDDLLGKANEHVRKARSPNQRGPGGDFAGETVPYLRFLHVCVRFFDESAVSLAMDTVEKVTPGFCKSPEAFALIHHAKKNPAVIDYVAWRVMNENGVDLGRIRRDKRKKATYPDYEPKAIVDGEKARDDKEGVCPGKDEDEESGMTVDLLSGVDRRDDRVGHEDEEEEKKRRKMKLDFRERILGLMRDME